MALLFHPEPHPFSSLPLVPDVSSAPKASFPAPTTNFFKVVCINGTLSYFLLGLLSLPEGLFSGAGLLAGPFLLS